MANTLNSIINHMVDIIARTFNMPTVTTTAPPSTAFVLKLPPLSPSCSRMFQNILAYSRPLFLTAVTFHHSLITAVTVHHSLMTVVTVIFL